MTDIVNCNKEQAEKILKTYFSQKPIVTRVSKDSDDGIYFIIAKTVPGMLRTEWQWRGFACFGEVYKGDRRYDLSYGYSDELMKSLNDACRKAVDNYEKGCDLFIGEEINEIKTYVENVKYVFKRDKKAYILCAILLIILIIKFIIG